MNIGIILSGGTGNRLGSAVPKQYLKLNGRDVISYGIEAMRKAHSLDKFVVAARGEYIDYLREEYSLEVTEGSDSRNRTIKNALNYIHKYNPDKIIIIDACRPLVTSEIIDDYMTRLEDYDAVITAQTITDSLGSTKEHVLNRAEYYLIQAPEAFKYDLLYENFDSESNITATNQQLPVGSKMYLNFNFTNNFKITYRSDLDFIGNLLKKRK